MSTDVTTITDLPLRYFTPGAAWVAGAFADPLRLLNDHAHLEKKAAANALELLNRWPEPNPPENWVAAMTAVARDEVDHLAVVTRILARRGGRLTRSHANHYAAALRQHVRTPGSADNLADRLIVSALIEARSCERFALLADHCPDTELAKLYKGLWASEAGHYRTFLQLARDLPGRPKIEARWEEFLDIEAEIIQAQPTGPRIHSAVVVA